MTVGLRQGLALLGLSATACQATEAWSPPELSGLASVLVVGVDREGSAPAWPNAPSIDGRQVVLATALDLDEGTPLPSFFGSPELELYVLGFACPLKAVGLKAGEQVLAELLSPTPDLPEPKRLLWRRGPAGAWAPWTEPAWPPALLDLWQRLPVEGTRCARMGPSFTAQAFPAQSSIGLYPAFAIPGPKQTALLGALEGSVVQIDAAGQVSPVQIDGIQGTILSAYPSGDEYWFLIGRGGLARGPLHGDKRFYGGAAELPTGRPELSSLMAMVGDPDADPGEVFLVTQDRALQRYDGERWEVLSRGAPRRWNAVFNIPLGGSQSVGIEFVPQILRLGQGRIATFGVTDRDNAVVYWDQGVLSERSLPGARYVLSLGQLADGRLMAGDERGEVYLEENDSWRPLGLRLGSPLTYLLPMGNSIWAASFSEPGLYRRDLGVCVGESLEFTVMRSAPLGEDSYLLTGGDGYGLVEGGPRGDGSPSKEVLLLTETAPPQDCGAEGY